MKYQYLKVFQITGLLLIDALTDCNVLMCSILLLYIPKFIPFHIAVILQQYPMKKFDTCWRVISLALSLLTHISA